VVSICELDDTAGGELNGDNDEAVIPVSLYGSLVGGDVTYVQQMMQLAWQVRPTQLASNVSHQDSSSNVRLRAFFRCSLCNRSRSALVLL